MRKRLQNKVAESKLTLPAVSCYAVVVWLLSGLVQQHWWLQFGCFVVTGYLMMQLQHINALLRIYSRAVSCTMLVLLCCSCFLFPSLRGGITQACVTGYLLLAFMTYQDREATGITYYAYLLLGVASLAFVHVLFFLPLLWLLTATQLQSLSWRTWFASLLGLATPYWILSCLLVWRNELGFLPHHFQALVTFSTPDLNLVITGLPLGVRCVLLFVIILAVIGTIHFIRQRTNDKIRTRLIYGFFIWMDLATILFLVLQPQHYDSLLRLAIIFTAPLAGHFLALTYTKVTNMAFWLFITAALLLTAFNLWTSSSLF